MESTPIEAWKKVWREGCAPILDDSQLAALRAGLATNDEHMLQGATTIPPPLSSVTDWPVEQACLLGYCFAACNGGFAVDYATKTTNPEAVTVGETEEFFVRMCYEIDTRLGEPAGCRFLLNWWDESPRAEVFSQLLAEVDLELERRGEMRLQEAGGR